MNCEWIYLNGGAGILRIIATAKISEENSIEVFIAHGDNPID